MASNLSTVEVHVYFLAMWFDRESGETFYTQILAAIDPESYEPLLAGCRKLRSRSLIVRKHSQGWTERSEIVLPLSFHVGRYRNV